MSNPDNPTLQSRENPSFNARLSTQALLPISLSPEERTETYDAYPYHTLVKGRIFNGYTSLAKWLVDQKVVLIDGYVGVFWDQVRAQLETEIAQAGYSVKIHLSSDYLKPASELKEMIGPSLGAAGSVWGTRTSLALADFYRLDELNQLNDCRKEADLIIIMGVGAALLSIDVPVIYLDVPKNEIQYRMRAGSIHNLGMMTHGSDMQSYKQFYFVDWVVLNEHRKAILERITIFADVQWENDINWMFFSNLTATAAALGKGVFRARPWFEKGVWGGQWIKDHLKGLNTSEVNYAWSFELISPENGLIFEYNGYLQEVPFDVLMLLQHKEILGKHAETFGHYFPIRFNFLDTFSGGNLSVQCHPSKEYINKEFGEQFTQDETYYIMDCKPGAKVYLGFQQDIDPADFKNALEESFENGTTVDITRYVQALPSAKHELFLIPNQTIHSSGIDNLVLEISATPYIFTFKMYDWVRLDFNNKPRPINIDHAFKNLDFLRKGSRVQDELIAKPHLQQKGADWQIIHLPTHQEHFYDVERIEFHSRLSLKKDDRCWVMMLVEGEGVTLRTDQSGSVHHFSYGETFVISAAVKNIELINTGSSLAKLVKAYLK